MNYQGQSTSNSSINYKYMNNFFHTATFARAWKIAEVTPIPKYGDPEY